MASTCDFTCPLPAQQCWTERHLFIPDYAYEGQVAGPCTITVHQVIASAKSRLRIARHCFHITFANQKARGLLESLSFLAFQPIYFRNIAVYLHRSRSRACHDGSPCTVIWVVMLAKATAAAWPMAVAAMSAEAVAVCPPFCNT